MSWPKVTIDDDGIRPAGKPDECLYCHSKVGQEHGKECVIVKKVVKVRYTYEIELNIPHSWDGDDIEFKRNEGSSCANNSVDEIYEYMEKIKPACLCEIRNLRENTFRCEFIEVIDDRPRTETVKPEGN